MRNLIRLEFKKYNYKGSIVGVGIANVVISIAAILFYFEEQTTGSGFLGGYPEILTFIDTIVRATFIIFASVLLARFVVEEYKTGTISLMFTYPVNRKKLICAKLLIVAAWTFVTIVISNIMVGSIIMTINAIYNDIPEDITASALGEHAVNVLLNAVAAAGMILIPLFFGMLKKSVPTTIVSSIIIVALVCSNNNGFSLSSIIAIPFSLAAIGVFLTYLGFRNIEHVDVK